MKITTDAAATNGSGQAQNARLFLHAVSDATVNQTGTIANGASGAALNEMWMRAPGEKVAP